MHQHFIKKILDLVNSSKALIKGTHVDHSLLLLTEISSSSSSTCQLLSSTPNSEALIQIKEASKKNYLRAFGQLRECFGEDFSGQGTI